MAIYEASTWAELKTMVASAESGDTVKLTADIDMNDNYSAGISNSDRINGSCTIDGDGHTIKNIVFRGSNSGIRLFEGTSSYWLRIKNIKLENTIIEKGAFTNFVIISDSDVTFELENDTSLGANTNFTRCGVACKGYINARFDDGNWWITDCNLTFNGSFGQMQIAPRRTFIQGNFAVINSYDLHIESAEKSVFVATYTGKIRGLDTGATNLNYVAINMDAVTGTLQYPAIFLQCNSEQIKSPSYLASQGFPILPVVVGDNS